MLNAKRVLVTGGTGSLGKALLQRAAEEGWPTEFVIFSRDETKQARLKSLYPQHTYILGDVAKYRDLRRAMQGVDTVFHFAAYKQVPSAQNNVPATIETNILGSQNIADLAVELGVHQVVATSTDKASQPVNFYGASKAAMEAIFQDANKYGKTSFHLARYGNVISSNESVIPLFKRQRDAGGPLTVTHYDMTRFWITLDQAINLVLRALELEPGAILVPKAPAMSVLRLAQLIGGDLPIKDIGIRPGEKIHESMVAEAESFHTCETEYHFQIFPPNTHYRNLTAPFSYTSDTAPVLTDDQMREMIRLTELRYGV